ncbi:lectin-like domain-containing protein [Lewinella cohaerens]|uniref:lectin-like domain-containing protein n=1 Tax=Lewinella cohaerens TaxID=70995 RepID=UPI000366F4FE|nr:gliding motility-associated C-terminal domain-containing protein [Lewinella cohaerens]
MNYIAQRLSLFAILYLSTCFPGQAQFFLNGNAVATNDSCYQLTAAVNWEAGSLWNGQKINLNSSFDLLADLFLGCEDLQGADGIVFGLQPISTSIGGGGGAIGFGDVEPALGVEFDTYQNLDFGDPVYDHITIISDGIVNHTMPQGALAGPVQANVDEPNIEDCEYHQLRITWDAETQTLSIYLDCDLRLTYTADIVNEIFNGDPLVFWGFTSATGGLNNVHEVCFSYTSFLNELADETICPGESLQLEASGGASYLWSPATGLSDTGISNPIASPTETTLYTVEILDDCGIPFYDDVLITVDNDQFDVAIDIMPNTTTAFPAGTELELIANPTPGGENYIYDWSSSENNTFSDPAADSTTVTTLADQEGTETYTVTATSEAGCVQEASISIENLGILYSVPNIFSPNGDGDNDVFGLFTKANIDTYNCKVFNRWGKVVFETNTVAQFWDGTFNNNQVPSESYLYMINFQIGDRQFEEQGSLTLVR